MSDLLWTNLRHNKSLNDSKYHSAGMSSEPKYMYWLFALGHYLLKSRIKIYCLPTGSSLLLYVKYTLAHQLGFSSLNHWVKWWQYTSHIKCKGWKVPKRRAWVAMKVFKLYSHQPSIVYKQWCLHRCVGNKIPNTTMFGGGTLTDRLML